VSRTGPVTGKFLCVCQRAYHLPCKHKLQKQDDRSFLQQCIKDVTFCIKTAEVIYFIQSMCMQAIVFSTRGRPEKIQLDKKIVLERSYAYIKKL